MRDDLKLAAYAVALGYTLSNDGGRDFGPGLFDAQGVPHDSLSFRIGCNANAVTVWQTARGWRVGRLIGEYYTRPRECEFFDKLKPALDMGAEIASGPPAQYERGGPCEFALPLALWAGQRPAKVSEAEAMEMLECVPPIYLPGVPGFLVGEAISSGFDGYTFANYFRGEGEHAGQWLARYHFATFEAVKAAGYRQ